MLSENIQALVDIFDTKYEPSLEFDLKYEEKKLRAYLDDLIKKETGWNKIAVSCRRMIICDRELDLETAKKILEANSTELTDKRSFVIEGNHFYFKDDPYESIRYINTCGLTSYRCGEYSKAFEFFNLAEAMSNEFDSLRFFIPDMTSNRIRTEFELFVQLLPAEIEDDYVEFYENKLDAIITSYKDQISIFEKEDVHIDPNTKIYHIYGHGMASLHHNLAEAYSKFLKRKELLKDNNKRSEFEEKAKEYNEKSLNYGEIYKDVYRQLQSKRALSEVGEKGLREQYMEEVLRGRWKRGQLMIFQKRISEAESIDDAEFYIIDDNFKLNPKEPDKIGLLYNYGSIKKFLEKNLNINYVETKDETILTGLGISYNKIKLAKELRKELYFLYRRQAMSLITDDILDIVDSCLKSGSCKKAISWSERFNCLGLRELSQLISLQYFSQEKLKEIEDESYNLKKPIFLEYIKEMGGDQTEKECEKNTGTEKQISNEPANFGKTTVLNHKEVEQKCLSDPVPLSINSETSEKLQKLILYYESLLDISSKNLLNEDSSLYEKLQIVLHKIPDIEKTAVIKFIILGKGDSKKICPLIIKKGELIKLEELRFDSIYNIFNYSNVKEILGLKDADIHDQINQSLCENMSDLSGKLKCEYTTRDKINQSLCENMSDLSGKLKCEYTTIEECLKGIKNIYIIPDGELFQLPLHLLFEDFENKNLNIYYSPSLYHLLSPLESQIYENEKISCLWVSCPTPDLISYYKNEQFPNEQYLPQITNMDLLFAEQAKIESFYDMYKNKKYTHLGFLTHGVFHDHSIDAYASSIMFNDSFLTPYDILLQLDFSGVQTVFLGACEVGSNKYTDKNEAIGIVTAFLDKNAISVIAPLWKITTTIYNEFIKALNESEELNSTVPWNLSSIKREAENDNILVPFVEYANIGMILSRLSSEERKKICELIKRREKNEK